MSVSTFSMSGSKRIVLTNIFLVPTPADYHSVGEMKRCNLFSLKKSLSSIIGRQQKRGPCRVANIDGKAQAHQPEAKLPEEWLPKIEKIFLCTKIWSLQPILQVKDTTQKQQQQQYGNNTQS